MRHGKPIILLPMLQYNSKTTAVILLIRTTGVGHGTLT